MSLISFQPLSLYPTFRTPQTYPPTLCGKMVPYVGEHGFYFTCKNFFTFFLSPVHFRFFFFDTDLQFPNPYSLFSQFMQLREGSITSSHPSTNPTWLLRRDKSGQSRLRLAQLPFKFPILDPKSAIP